MEVFSTDTWNLLHFDGVDNVFSAAQLPVTLVVLGVHGSNDMRDVTLTESVVGGESSDSVNFTVLWLTGANDHLLRRAEPPG